MNKKLKSIAVLALWLTLLTPAVTLLPQANGSNPTEPLALKACIAVALKNNPGLTAQSHTLTSTKAVISETKSQKLPTISASANYTRSSQLYPLTGKKQNYNFSIQTQQPLYRGGRISNSIKNARALHQANTQQYETYRRDLILSVKEMYFNVLKNQRLLETSKQALKQSQTNLEAAKARFQYGAVRKADVTKAEVETSDARLNLIKAENNLLTSRGQLNKILGLPITQDTQIKDLLETHVPAPQESQTENLFQQAEKNLPELKEIEHRIKARKAAVNIAKSAYLPSLDANASWYWNGSSFSKLDRDWDVGLSLNIPIFQGFSRKAAVTRQKAQLETLRDQKEELRQQIALELRLELLKIKETEQRIENSRKHLENARENLRIAEGEYKEGVNSMLELIDAQTTFVDAEKNHIDTLAEYQVAQARLQRKTGIVK